MSEDTLIRRANLREICKKRGWVQPDGSPSPKPLADAIGRKTNQVSDILHGRASFGEDLARHIETKLGLSKWTLDGGAGWPFPTIDRDRFDNLPLELRIEIQGVVRERIETFERTAPPPLSQNSPPKPPPKPPRRPQQGAPKPGQGNDDSAGNQSGGAA